jgi:ABC-type iron transport system FetAB permease component
VTAIVGIPLDTVSVTGTEVVVAPAVTTMESWYVPAAIPDTFADTVRVAGVVAFPGATISQVEFELAVKLVAPLALSTCTLCDAGAGPPGFCENDNDTGVTVGAISDTVKVTGTETAVLPAVTTMEPWYVPAASPDAFTETFTSAGVVPVDGRALSQPPFQPAAKVVEPLALSTRIVCIIEAAPPSVCENDNDAGVTVIVGATSDTVKVTGTKMVAVPAVTVMEPWYVPNTPDALTDTVRVAGVVAFAGATASQVEFELAVKAVAPLELSTRIVCEAGAAPPSVCENDNNAGVAVRDVGLDTVSVTGTERVAVPAVTVIAPWYDPPASPDALTLTDTVRVPGVVALPGATESQVAFEAAVKAVAVPVLVMLTVCAAGAVPPIACENDMDAGAAISDPAADRVSVTGTVRVVVPAVTVIAPWYVFAASPDAFTDTVRVAGVVAFDGATASHAAFEAAVNVVAVPPALSTTTVWDAAAVPPIASENDKDTGTAVSDPAADRVSVTGTVRVVVPAVTVIAPWFGPAASPDALALTDTVRVPGVVAFPGATESQITVEAAVKAIAVPVLVILTVCAAGAVPPIACENDKDAGMAVSDVVAADRVNVTGTMRVVVPAVTVIAPWYVLAASPDALTDTVRVPGVVALPGVTESQVAFEAAVKAIAVPVLVMLTVCAAGAVPPIACENDKDAGVAVSDVVAADRVSVTGTVRVVVPAVTVIAPWYVLAASPDVLIDTVSVPGVVALPGVTESQVAFEAAAKAVAAPVLVILTVCAIGAAPPTVCENDNEVGVAVTVPPPPPVLTVMPTFMTCCSRFGNPVKTIEPPIEPGSVRTDGSAVIVTVAGVVPDSGDADNQKPASTSRINDSPAGDDVTEILRVCRAPPSVVWKFMSDDGLTDSPAVDAPTVRVTGMEALTAPGAATEMDPVYWPSGKLEGSTATEILLDLEVDPLAGWIASQEPESTEAL